ncbi:MAG: PrsW family intramembrane metalloprotease [Candidatus Aminicenantes bacterium]|nr:PrsW family intramembrane metalloprotease [Candidatus Aminicenantes bacterium]NIM79529.1 PrsW family intramembrane metalloprotease [Candidatus Aminicenantes bacterium]NIN18843.1 PrsW family intramembrane metalloprotease [Candidatus Aminicenantes bacterium]NIN42756.1 PrsW family intramembrane metalloprotease [Candidatus Aminicenantes bacterium]NIN85483.1 PrsW family intramembrane metalloprotease [Candidatus Aminicenantes bacterium]
MTFTLIAAGIVAPALFWIGYFYYKDRFQPEPLLYIGLTYIFGFAAAYLCYKSYGLLPLLGLPADASLIMETNRLVFLGYSIGAVGVLEEFFKFLPFLVVLRFKAFDEKIDGIIYASVIALGFASFENLYYLVYLDGFELIGRAIASPLTHTIFSSIWGYTVGVAYLSKQSPGKAALKGLIIASLLHGIFDFLTTSPTLRLLSAFFILAIWIWRIRVIEGLHKKEYKKSELE